MSFELFTDINFLIVIAFFTSALTATVGLGGGVLLLALMPGYLPLSQAIPLHGAIQLFSNLSRSLLKISDVKWTLVKEYFWGGAIGIIIGYFFIGAIADTYLTLGLGVFILLIMWTPLFKILGKWLQSLTLVASVQAFLSLFVGSTGLLSPPILIEKGLNKNEVIVTHAAQMSLMHMMKVAAFSVAGVSIMQFGSLMLGMIAGSIAGSWAGSKVRDAIPERAGQIILRAIITLLALKLIMSFFY